VEGGTVSTVERYLELLAKHDWDGLRATLAAEGLVRDGPFCDVIHGRDDYVAFLRDIVTSLEDYLLTTSRVSYVGDRLAFAELSETFRVNGELMEYPECLLFELDETGLIRGVSVFMKTPGAEAPVAGGRAEQR
jgi:SnoaL-like domain